MIKKILFFSVFGLTISALNAQITVTSADVVTVGQMLRQANDSTPTVAPGSAGAAKTWNFSGLHATTIDTVISSNPSSTPDGALFPSSNLALIEKLTNDTIYANNSSSAFVAQGEIASFAGNTVPVHLNPSETLLAFPATYLSHFLNNYSTTIRQAITTVPGFDSVRVRSVFVGKDTVDAYGSMQTPLGTYNVIRVNEFQITADTIWLRSILGTWSIAPISGNPSLDTNYHFSWYANGLGDALASMDSAKSGGSISNVQWLMSVPVPAGVANIETASNNVLVFPNPANNEISFSSAEKTASSVRVCDITGRVMMTKSLTNTITNSVNTSALSNGIYIYTLYDKNNIPFATGKFTVIR